MWGSLDGPASFDGSTDSTTGGLVDGEAGAGSVGATEMMVTAGVGPGLGLGAGSARAMERGATASRWDWSIPSCT